MNVVKESQNKEAGKYCGFADIGKLQKQIPYSFGPVETCQHTAKVTDADNGDGQE
jgi:hypothetical protein